MWRRAGRSCWSARFEREPARHCRATAPRMIVSKWRSSSRGPRVTAAGRARAAGGAAAATTPTTAPPRAKGRTGELIDRLAAAVWQTSWGESDAPRRRSVCEEDVCPGGRRETAEAEFKFCAPPSPSIFPRRPNCWRDTDPELIWRKIAPRDRSRSKNQQFWESKPGFPSPRPKGLCN